MSEPIDKFAAGKVKLRFLPETVFLVIMLIACTILILNGLGVFEDEK